MKNTLMTTKKSDEMKEAISRLRETLHAGDTVYTVVRSTSRTNMQATIQLIVFSNKLPLWLGYNVAKGMGCSYDRKNEGVIMRGCGYNRADSLVSDLAFTLFGDFKALKNQAL